MERPKIEDFNKGWIDSFDKALKVRINYSKKQDEYIDYLESKALNIDDVSKSLNADELVKSLGEPIKNNEYKLIADDSGVWWLEHKHIGSGEPLKQWLTGKP